MSSVQERGYVARLNPVSIHSFFSSVPDGVFNSITPYMDQKEFVRLHQALHSDKRCRAHWRRNLSQYVHHTVQLFDKFTSVEALRWVARNIEGVHGFELRLGGKSHEESFVDVCQLGDAEIVRAVMERSKVDLETRVTNGRTPLHHAADLGHLSVVQYLYEQGGDTEAVDKYDWTPLLMAAKQGHLPVVQYLCEQGSDKEARSTSGRTPLHMAADIGHFSVVRYLCEQGADKEARSLVDQTPLHVAAEKRHKNVYKFLKYSFVPLERGEKREKTQLSIAMQVLFSLCFRCTGTAPCHARA